MKETELAEIESRILEYLVRARREILKLTSEMRSQSGFTEPAKSTAASSPLYDSITALLNGDAYGVQFAAAKARAKRQKKRFAVLSVYLTFSKEKPNASEYNAALRVVAERLEKCVRTTDTVARVDSEEFAVLLEDLAKDGQAHLVMQKVQQALGEPVSLGGRNIHFDASVNVQVYPKAEKTDPTSPVDP